MVTIVNTIIIFPWRVVPAAWSRAKRASYTLACFCFTGFAVRVSVLNFAGTSKLTIKEVCDGVIDTSCLFVHSLDILDMHIDHALLIFEALLDLVLRAVLAEIDVADNFFKVSENILLMFQDSVDHVQLITNVFRFGE